MSHSTTEGKVDHPHPGEIIEKFMRSQEIGEELVSKRTGIDIEMLREILSQRVPVTKRTANQLTNAFGRTRKEFWLKLQEDHDAARL